MKMMKLKRDLIVLTILFVFIKSETIHGKCLDVTEMQSKNYVHYIGKTYNLTIQTTSRATHQMTSHIFKIFLEEILSYRQVQIINIEDDFNATNVINVLTGPYSSSHEQSIPKAMINLEVLVPSYMDTVAQLASVNVLDCGTLRNSAQFGWFIPKSLTGPIKNFDPNWREDFEDIPWTFFKDENFSSTFHINDKSTLLGTTQLNISTCDNEETCAYIPEKCIDKTCATLLAPMSAYTKFLKDQIDDYDIYVEVIWLGEHFKQATRKVQNSLRNKSNQSVLIMAWTPSDIIYPENDFVRVIFNKCKYNEINHYCEVYETMKLEKFAWSKLKKHASSAYEAIKNIEFNPEAYHGMMKIYNEHDNKTKFDEMACKWLNLNKDIYDMWSRRSSKQILFIGGIYPIKDRKYNGGSLVSSAILAVEHVNNNPGILSNYELKLINMDGECNAEIVMRSFIKYVDGDNTDNIVGVLGPACSDTVEPLAGVSNNFKMLIISYSAEGASFSDREKYPYFFRTIASNSEFRFVYLELLKKLNWKRVAALTEDGQKYTEYISYTQNLLESNGITFIANAKFPKLRKGLAMDKYLEDLKKKRARIIIADVYDEIARLVMCKAYKLDMTMKHGYIWFLPTWLDSKWYDTDFYNKNNFESVECDTSTMINAINGYFSLKPSSWGDDDLITVTGKTVKDWKDTYDKKLIDIRTNKTSDYAGFTYDAVWTYALALNKLVETDPDAITELHSNATTHKLVNYIENSDFNGVSGRIHFRGGSTRYSTIHLTQWIEKNFTTVGIFRPNITNDSTDILGGNLDLNLSNIVWLSGNVPDDGTTPPEMCSLDLLSKAFNVDCEMAIVILCIIIFVVFLILIGIAMFFYKKKMDSKYRETQMLIEALGLDQRIFSDLDKWEVAREHVVINRKLGEGAFGTVYGGEVYVENTGWVAVAVKTLKRGSTSEEKVDFLSEAESMKKFDHKNIVKLIGVCIKDEPVYTIMEFMLYGDLKTYLLARRNLVNRKNWDDQDDISSKRLTKMALDIARGLSYLADLKFVHRDIACRNCLVNSNKVVKIGDFGMARAMYDNDYYRFNRKGMLPVRWMAPESLALGVFTPASDIWSYGVVLYEVITFGSFPFQGMSNNQVLDHVKNGNTLNVPKGVKPQLEMFLKSCWHEDSKKRPTAVETVDFLANNPQLISPSLEGPTAAVAMEGSDELEVHIPTELRHRPSSTATTTFINNSFAKPSSTINNVEPLETPLIDFSERPQRGSAQDSGVSVHFDNYCPREPLLGNLERSTSMNEFNYVTVNHNHSSPNLYNSTTGDLDKEIQKRQLQQPHVIGNGVLCSN